MYFYEIEKHIRRYLLQSKEDTSLSLVTEDFFNSFIVTLKEAIRSSAEPLHQNLKHLMEQNPLYHYLNSPHPTEIEIGILISFRNSLNQLTKNFINTDQLKDIIRHLNSKIRLQTHLSLNELKSLLKLEPSILTQIDGILTNSVTILTFTIQNWSEDDPFYNMVQAYNADMASLEFLKIYEYCAIARIFENNGDALDHALKLFILFDHANLAFDAINHFGKQSVSGMNNRYHSPYVHDACLFSIPLKKPNHWLMWKKRMRESLGDTVFSNCFANANAIERHYEGDQLKLDHNAIFALEDIKAFYIRECEESFVKIQPLIRHLFPLQFITSLEINNPHEVDTIRYHNQLKSVALTCILNKVPFESLDAIALLGVELLQKSTLQEKVKYKQRVLKLIQQEGELTARIQSTLNDYLQYFALEQKNSQIPFSKLSRNAIIGISIHLRTTLNPSLSLLAQNGLSAADMFVFENIDRSKAGNEMPNLHFQLDEFVGFYFKKLDVSKNWQEAALGACLGKQTNCCQHIGGAGHDCTLHGLTSPNGAFYVLFKGDYSHPSVNDTVVAQSWAWLTCGIEGNLELVFDSIEYDRSVIKKLMDNNSPISFEISIFISKIMTAFYVNATLLIINNNPKITKISVGLGGSTPDCFDIYRAGPSSPMDYLGYSDSTLQGLLYSIDFPTLPLFVDSTLQNKQRLTMLIQHAMVNEPRLADNQNIIVFLKYIIRISKTIFIEHPYERVQYFKYILKEINSNESRYLEQFFNFSSLPHTDQLTLLELIDFNVNLSVKLSDVNLKFDFNLDLQDILQKGVLSLTDHAEKSFLALAANDYTLLSTFIAGCSEIALSKLIWQRDGNGNLPLFQAVDSLPCFSLLFSLYPTQHLLEIFQFHRNRWPSILTLIYQKPDVLIHLLTYLREHNLKFYEYSSENTLSELPCDTWLHGCYNAPYSFQLVLDEIPETLKLSYLKRIGRKNIPVLKMKSLHFNCLPVALPIYPEEERFGVVFHFLDDFQSVFTLIQIYTLLPLHQRYDAMIHSIAVIGQSKLEAIQSVFSLLTHEDKVRLTRARTSSGSSLLTFAIKNASVLAFLFGFNDATTNRLIIEEKINLSSLLIKSTEVFASFKLLLDLYPSEAEKQRVSYQLLQDPLILGYIPQDIESFRLLCSRIPTETLRLKCMENQYAFVSRFIDYPNIFILLLEVSQVQSRTQILRGLRTYENKFKSLNLPGHIHLMKRSAKENVLLSLFNLLSKEDCLSLIEMPATSTSSYDHLLYYCASYPEAIIQILMLYPEDKRYDILWGNQSFYLINSFPFECARASYNSLFVLVSLLPEQNRLSILTHCNSICTPILIYTIINGASINQIQDLVRLIPPSDMDPLQNMLNAYYLSINKEVPVELQQLTRLEAISDVLMDITPLDSDGPSIPFVPLFRQNRLEAADAIGKNVASPTSMPLFKIN